MKRLLLILALLPLPFNAHAWTPAADRRIAAAGAKLAAPDVYALIQSHDRDFARGLQDARKAPPGALRERIEHETRTVIAMLKTDQPPAAVAERLGALAYLVAAANTPAASTDYARYFESRVGKFPVVFYGAEPQLQLGAFVDRMLARTAGFGPLLAAEYARGDSSTFDDHSTAFGIASVCYSHAVTDTANLFTHIWRDAKP